MASELLVQYSTSTAFASALIRRLSHSPFSHVDILLPGEGLLGVSGPDNDINDPGGVMVRSLAPWDYLTIPKVARVQASELIVRTAVEFARSQIGKPFDDTALWTFLSDQAKTAIKRDWRDPSKWFCSEFLIRAVEVGGLFSYPLIVVKEHVSPGDSLLIVNPFLTPENIAEF